MKSILLHVCDDIGLEPRIQVALDLARTFDAHVTFLQTITYPSYAAGDMFGVMAAEIIPAIQDAANTLRAKVEQRLDNEDVSWEWIEQEGQMETTILGRVSTYDLVVLGAVDPVNPDGVRSGLAADMAVHANTPVLLVPKAQLGFDCARPAIVAWDGSAEVSRALRAAIPILRHAGAVYLVAIDEAQDERPGDLPSTAGSEYLSRHGIPSELVEMGLEGSSVADRIKHAARLRKAGLIVMGAYGRSRLRELLLGGVTRQMMTDPELPLLLHH